jgi:uroporphyrinogen-III synthase
VAVGAGTARALHRNGVRQVVFPDRDQTSEGLLGLPLWQQTRGTVGLVSAPGGRDLIEPALRARGLQVRRADVYRREPLPARPATLARLRRLTRVIVVITSAEALDSVVAALGRPPPGWKAVVSSARLQQIACAAGFAGVLRAAGPGGDALIECLRDHAKAERFR